MTTSYKTKVRVAQQYQQAVPLKLLQDPITYVRGWNNTEHPPHKNTPSMSIEWNVLPFAYPENKDNRQKSKPIKSDPEKRKIINDILMFSLKQQKEEGVSDNPGFVTIVVSRCLDAKNILNRIDCGFRRMNNISLPHMWLVIDGFIIDNTYVKELPVENLKYLCDNTPGCYLSRDFSELDKNHLAPKTPDDSFMMACNILGIRINFDLKNSNKALALGLNNEQLFNYYFSMIRYMYDTFRVSVVGIDPTIRSVCWWCGCYPKSGRSFLSDILKPNDVKETDSPSKVTWKFPHCNQCMVANYCSIECQKADWLDNHVVSCFSRGSAYLHPLQNAHLMCDPA